MKIYLPAALFLLSAALLLSMSIKAETPPPAVENYVLTSKEAFKHDMSSYTQGLFFYNGEMYESAGQYGSSSFRKVDPVTGKVLKSIQFPPEYFAEGSCAVDGRAYVLTWKEGLCMVYDLTSFVKLAEFRYSGEGWGLTTDGKSLIMSNGTSTLSFRDPMTFLEQHTLEVRLDGKPVQFLNELEYIDGKIWANVYGLDFIVIIDPATGNVTGRIDCRGLLDAKYRTRNIDVFNGIAYNPEDNSIYLTGKYWPIIYKVTIKRAEDE